jgi:hypothetical protein
MPPSLTPSTSVVRTRLPRAQTRSSDGPPHTARRDRLRAFPADRLLHFVGDAALEAKDVRTHELVLVLDLRLCAREGGFTWFGHVLSV